MKRLKESNDEMIRNLLVEAEERNNPSSTKLLTELANNNNIDISDLDKIRTSKKNDSAYDYVNKLKESQPIVTVKKHSNDISTNIDESSLYSIDDFDTPHDIVPLPSKGIIYKNVKSKIPVAYLTASDEDLITSPNLYIDGKITDLLLRKKILDRDIDPSDLCKGDRDAIIVWLRASGYGSNFPVNVRDPLSGEYFETEVDLSQLKIKEFNLKSDIDGYFDFELPKSKHLVKFRFLSHKDDVGYTRELEKTNVKLKKMTLKNSINVIKTLFDTDEDNESVKSKIYESIDNISNYISNLNDNDNDYLKNITYLLEKSIISINDITDREFIKKYIKFMPVMDSLALRRYINDNTPGVDFRVTVQRPQSLGGGSFETFLEIDSTIFINLT